MEGPKRKRQALDPESLQQRVSGLLGRPIDSLSLFKIMPYMPGAPENIYSGESLPGTLPFNTTKPWLGSRRLPSAPLCDGVMLKAHC